ncbi:MAG: DsrE family protein [Alphaproteobacteria bacterium]|nr:DsrE family protein [Alphaproteobacteria bacterium]
MRTLNVIGTAYRATLEEQDDPVIWITRAMQGAGGEFDVLLQGNAVNYVTTGQHVPALAFGARRQSHAPALGDDVEALMSKGSTVYVVAEDLDSRGVHMDEVIPGISRIGRDSVPRVFQSYDRVWRW